ncbi:MAG: hypothetical protein R3300_19290, partial [Candidatus Promineifilaceae bacterium]|nr:hypothetical protein [Candidatus Promineifilaceae bacterium]
MHLPLRVRSSVIGFGLLVLSALLGLILWSAGAAQAERPTSELAPPATEIESAAALDWSLQADPAADDAACRQCHGDTEAVIEFPSGETLAVQVDQETLSGSAHGMHAGTSLACTDCHSAASYQIPHEPVEAPDLRAYELERSSTCERCHTQPHISSHPGRESETPVVCTDCHGA